MLPLWAYPLIWVCLMGIRIGISLLCHRRAVADFEDIYYQ